jgi:hypothetical protein
LRPAGEHGVNGRDAQDGASDPALRAREPVPPLIAVAAAVTADPSDGALHDA